MQKNLFLQNRVFVIAELANSHEGDVDIAKLVTKKASEAGANAIKFQKFYADELVSSNHKNFDLYKKLEMTNSEWKQLIAFAKSEKLRIFVDVFGIKSAKIISKFGIDGYKIHSSDIANPNLLKFLGKKKNPILLSAAGSNLNEIDNALSLLLNVPKEIAIMHGFQGYPTSINDLNLENIKFLKSKYKIPIGISDHISGSSKLATIIPLLALTLGATIIEKHITLNRDHKKIDYQSSLNPLEFKELVSLTKKTKTAIQGNNFVMSNQELNYKQTHRKIPITKVPIKRGTVLTENLFEFKRTSFQGNSSPYFDFVGKKSSISIAKGKILIPKMLENNSNKTSAIIACRVGSERLFAKPLQKLGKYSILHVLINQLKKSKHIDDIVLAISDAPGNDLFINYAQKNNLKFVVGDDVDVLKRLIDGAKYVNAKTIVRVTSENPFIYWEGIDNLLKNHIKNKNDLTHYSELPLGSSIEIINVNALEKSHKMGTKKHRSELCTLYINENPRKFKISRIKPPKKLQKSHIRLTVDTPEDLQVARIIQSRFSQNSKPIRLSKIVTFLENNPEILKINNDIPVQHRIF